MNVVKQWETVAFTKLIFERSYKVKVLRCERLLTGHTNLIYKLYLEDSRIFISRISTSRPAKALEYEAKLHEFLTQSGIHCPRIIGDMHVQMVVNEQTGKQYPSILMEFIDGEHPKSLNDLIIAGRELGRLHSLKAPTFAKRKAGFNLQKFKSLQLPNVFGQYLRPTLLEDIVFMVESNIKNCDRSICHGDLFRINTLIHQHKIYFFDFESMGVDITLLDLGKALFGMITPHDTQIEPENARAFLKGYFESKVLPEQQVKILPYIAAMAGVQTAYWRYNYWIQNPNHHDINEHLWEDALTASVSWLHFSF